MVCVGDVLRVVKDKNSLENDCVGPVVSIQNLEGGITAYNLKITVDINDRKCETLCQVRENEFEMVEKSRNDVMDLEDIIFDK